MRVWRRDGRILAVGLLDGRGVLRMTVAPAVWREDELARDVVSDLSAPTGVSAHSHAEQRGREPPVGLPVTVFGLPGFRRRRLSGAQGGCEPLERRDRRRERRPSVEQA